MDLTSLLYSLAEGKQKERATQEGGLRESAYWVHGHSVDWGAIDIQ